MPAVETGVFGVAPSLVAKGDEEGGEDVVVALAVTGLTGPAGEEKNDVMDAFFGFLAVLATTSAAFLLAGVAIVGVWRHWELTQYSRSKVDSFTGESKLKLRLARRDAGHVQLFPQINPSHLVERTDLLILKRGQLSCI